MKKLILSMLAVSALVFTSCSDDDDNSVVVEKKSEVEVIIADYAHLKEGHVAMLGDKIAKTVREDMKAWEAEAKKIGALTTEAKKGTAGFLPDGEKKRYVNANAVETSQLVAKGLIGAYQLNGFNANIHSAYTATNAQGRLDGLSKAVAYILGKYDPANPKSGDEFKAEGNSFGKYMTKFPSEQDAIYAAIKDAKENAGDAAKFMLAITKLNTNVTMVVAKRAVHYMYKYSENIKSEWTGHNVHELSEGLGFAYSLQFAMDSKSHEPYITKEKADEIIKVNLWDYKDSDSKSLQEKAIKIAEMFGFDAEKA